MRRALTILGTLGLLTLGACSEVASPNQPTYDGSEVTLPPADDDSDVRRPKLDP